MLTCKNLLTFLACFMCITDINAQVANFSYTQTSACSPYTISFTNLSVNYTASLWVFGTSAPPPNSTQTNPTVQFSAPGTYNVTLTVTNGTNNGDITLPVTIITAPLISMSADAGDTACTGTNVSFTATPTLGGTSPTYHWKKNGANVGANSSTYASTFLANGDKISCVLTSNAGCVNPDTVVSDTVLMTMLPDTPVSITLNCPPTDTLHTIVNLNATVTGAVSYFVTISVNGTVENTVVGLPVVYYKHNTGTDHIKAVIMAAPGGCYFPDSTTCTILDATAGVAKIIGTASDITVYPNPAKDDIIVSFSDAVVFPATLIISDATGRAVYTSASLKGKGEAHINVSGLPPGLYLLQLQSIDGERRTEKITKE